jgi:hypothetical protein
VAARDERGGRPVSVADLFLLGSGAALVYVLATWPRMPKMPPSRPDRFKVWEPPVPWAEFEATCAEFIRTVEADQDRYNTTAAWLAMSFKSRVRDYMNWVQQWNEQSVTDRREGVLERRAQGKTPDFSELPFIEMPPMPIIPPRKETRP